MTAKKYVVTRFCCSAAQCVDCHQRDTSDRLDMRKRVVQLTTDNIDRARKCVASHAHYGARLEMADGSTPPGEKRFTATIRFPMAAGATDVHARTEIERLLRNAFGDGVTIRSCAVVKGRA